jgi:hypothetical protein
MASEPSSIWEVSNRMSRSRSHAGGVGLREHVQHHLSVFDYIATRRAAPTIASQAFRCNFQFNTHAKYAPKVRNSPGDVDVVGDPELESEDRRQGEDRGGHQSEPDRQEEDTQAHTPCGALVGPRGMVRTAFGRAARDRSQRA